ncbi:MAG: PAS domain S-box protein [Candidatus Methanoperedens sp.]|nr:PAS domain S-box protein [Candidatus Methanoperedens sp.]
MLLQKDKRVPGYYIWVSLALISMGLLDGFHAFSPQGDSFVWMHGMAVLVGGFLFAMVWMPDRIARSRPTGALHIVVVVVIITLSIFSVYSHILPTMISEGNFTSVAKTINMLGGFFFLSAAVFFVIRYKSNHSHEDFLFLNFCLLNGWAGLLFQFSQIWDADWWFWHVLRLAAYLTVLSYMFITFQRYGAELTQHREHLKELVQKRTGELKMTNEQLQQEIVERKRAQEKLHKAHDELEIRVQERTEELVKANETLVEVEASYRELAESIGDIFYALDQDLRYTYWNNASEALTGILAKDVAGKSLFEIFPELKGARAEKLYTEVLKTQRPVHFINKFRVGGKDLIFEINAYPSKSGLSVIAKDITQRKHAEENLSNLLKELETIFENLPLGIAYLDSEFKLLNANKFFYELTGLNEDDLIGRPCYETVGEYADSTKKGLEKICSFCKKDECFNTRRPTIIERPLGNSIVKVTTIPQVDDDGSIFRFLEIVENITQSKLSDAALRESEGRYRNLVEASPDTIAIHSEGKIVFINPAGAKLLGATNPEQLIGKEIMDFVHPDYREAVKERVQQMKEEREDVPLIEEKFVRLDGSVIDVEVTATPFIHQGKHGMQIIVRDITEKKKSETQFLRAQRLESIGTLASGIAHDINNILTPMMLSLQLLQEKITDNGSQKLLNALERSTQRGASLVKQIQSFAIGVEGKRTDLQVSHLISEITQIAKETFPRSIEIRTDMSKDLWTICGDATQLHQVLMNLCVNARDAMPDGGILRISTENIFIDENYSRMNIDAKVDQYIVITVSDTGTGIPPEIMDRIFDPFFTTKQHGKGTGLGLSTALGIVKSHGGFMNVYSEVGKGTVFKVYLPVVMTIGTIKDQKVKMEQPELLRGKGESILVVDDENMIREITCSILETHGYKVIMANDGKEATALYFQHKEEIKLVLIDMMMPIMDGPASIRELRKVNPDIKIIGVSGLTEKDKLAEVSDIHLHAFLTKPYTAEKLLKNIYVILREK